LFLFLRAKCFHCSRDLCLIHLTEHTQYIENESRTFYYSHEKVLNDLYNKLKSLSISSCILEIPFIQLEKWRRDAHQKLDRIAEQKHQEIQQKITEYQIEFTKKTNEQKQKIEILIKHLNDLSRQTQITTKNIKYLEEKIIETKTFLQSITKHSIKVSTYSFSVNIQTNFFDSQTLRTTPSSSPNIIQSRKTRPESKEFVSNGTKQRFDKKRSSSVCLL
jgi:hypothetical protein